MAGAKSGGLRQRKKSAYIDEWVAGLSFHADIDKYENLTGTIVAHYDAVGYIVGVGASGSIEKIKTYKVRLDSGVDVDNLSESCLKLIDHKEGLTITKSTK